MTYPFLAFLFFLTILVSLLLLVSATLRLSIWTNYKKKVLTGYIMWIVGYKIFILLWTGPTGLNVYPPAQNSPYKLPWKAGVERFVSQGNRSFTSHRDLHFHAWDFFMKNGTEILTAREGRVVEVVDQFDGIGLKSNYIKIEHEDGTRAMYAHIRKRSSKVKVGAEVKQGQPIALSGMVGQTIYPHLHFVVFNSQETSSIPISFSDVEGGVPLAGHFYTSQNSNLDSP